MKSHVGIEARRALGAFLRGERELRGIPLAEVSEATKVPMRSLEVLETGDWDGLPAMIFIRGFVRSYARHLGIEREALQRLSETTALIERQDQAQVEPVGDSATDLGARRRVGVALFVIILLIIVSITFSVLWGVGADASARASLEPHRALVQSTRGCPT